MIHIHPIRPYSIDLTFRVTEMIALHLTYFIRLMD
jgi:hypothetical protein